MLFGQGTKGFIPKTPDTLKLKTLEVEGDHTQSLAHLYLSTYYETTSAKDSIAFYEWDANGVCAFQQSFENGISYKIDVCSEESGGNESISFPKMDNKAARKFIELLFYDKWNSWTSEKSYEPEGAGCYYSIEHSADRTTIDIYCGC
jgi:hypothetical protein